MIRSCLGVCFVFVVFFGAFSAASQVNDGAQQNTTFKEIEWPELMPADDLEALLNPPEMLLDIKDGSQADSLDSFSQQEMEDESAKRFQEALTSTKVVTTYAGKPIRIPGFIVPLEFSEEQLVTEFFIVPYFGACLHMPPPPPNQIIFVAHNKGVNLNNLYDPFWFEGVLSIDTQDKELGTSAYTLNLKQLIPYEE